VDVKIRFVSINRNWYINIRLDAQRQTPAKMVSTEEEAQGQYVQVAPFMKNNQAIEAPSA
jgi:hypothetical protein